VIAGAVKAALLLALTAAGGADLERREVQREGVFEFAQAPQVTRAGDRVTVRFETKGRCDVTVAIEENGGAAAGGNGNPASRPRIVRHLASGVLGKAAPPPFRKDSLKQVLVWDGKDDQGRYVDDKDALTVRVSLGLKARFERALFWHPKKRVGLFRNPVICAQPEGVYVYEGAGVEMVRLYGHDGRYLRTVYPFPSSAVERVDGIDWKTESDGFRYPQKQGYWRSTFLLSGRAGSSARNHAWGSGARCMTVANGRIAIVDQRVERFGTDSTSRGLKRAGPAVWQVRARSKHKFLPHSAALGPAGKVLYLTGFHANYRPLGGAIQIPNIQWMHGVYRMDLSADAPPALWKGENDRAGKDEGHFNMPAAVACDARGRVYVADHFNDRVQVFSPAGKLVKSIRVNGPAQLQLHHRTGQLYVFSWRLPWPRKQFKKVKAMLRTFGPLPKARLLAEYPVPLSSYTAESPWWFRVEDDHRAAVDSWTDPPTVWLVPGPASKPWGVPGAGRSKMVNDARILMFAEKGGTLEPLCDFNREVAAAVVRPIPPVFQRQRLYVDPVSGLLYLAEGNTGAGKSFGRLLEIDPRTARYKEIPLPVAAEDMAIDANGSAYLRVAIERQNVIGRFELGSWRQVPFDYGEARGRDYFKDGRTKLASALIVPGWRPVYWHQSGMDVTPGGELVVHCYNRPSPKNERSVHRGPRGYSPRLYPGRYFYGSVHVWDKHGKLKHLDTVPGLPDGHGTCVDLNGDIYVLAACHRLVNGRAAFGKNAGTVIKFKPGKGRLVSSKNCKVGLGAESRPKGPPQLGAVTTGPVWADGAEWLYSGIGVARPSAPCQCWNCRFDVDYFGRTFAPETDRCQVAVLDTAGNLILHVGRYGNVDEGVPLATERKPGTWKPKPLGGDEVSFVYPVYLATHTDRRLFVADPGSGRIVSVRLGYHAERKVALKGIRNKAATPRTGPWRGRLDGAGIDTEARGGN